MSQAKIEKIMDEYFVKKAPFQIPQSGRKTLVQWIPYIALIFGILSILAFLSLWDAGHKVNETARTVNEIGSAYGIESSIPELGALYYVSVVAILTEAALLLVAFPGLKNRSKSMGWMFLVYGALANLAYGVLIAFTSQGGAIDFAGSLIGVTVSLYILAQVRGHYSDGKKKSASK